MNIDNSALPTIMAVLKLLQYHAERVEDRETSTEILEAQRVQTSL